MAPGRGKGGGLAVGLLLAGVAAWLWPVGFGGKMPVGGDVTQFSLGPMAVLARALKGGRLPLWNDLWGYGFPGVGESQMGVFYPPHWLLYGTLPLEHAYTASLVLHTLWGALGAWFAARRFGASAPGAALGGFAWGTCGFFVIHRPHQWGYTTGSWMPWAWGLAWSILRGEATPRAPLLLALVLAAQLLPGHFQLAFCTQVGLLVLVAEQAAERLAARSGEWRRALPCLAALGGAFVLAAAQVWPTLRLARLAATRRDFEYLSGFAASPLHLVSFFAPALFGVSPLWRPLVWDPLHTSPEEYLGFVGVVPLFLALGAVGGGWRRSPAVRALAAVGLVTLLLSLGPYLPGFRVWSHWPGFSFFRAPARWTLAASLALACLAALGFDTVGQWRRPSRAVLAFVLVGVGLTAGAVLVVELALASTGRPGWPAVARYFDATFAALPWAERSAFATAAQAARRPNVDIRVQEAWARQGVRLSRAPRPVFAAQRFGVYRQELTATALVYTALIGLAPLARSRGFRPALVVLAVLDLGYVGLQRRLDVGPVASLVRQSPVLSRLAEGPAGLRTLDASRNLPMVADAAPVSAYRTLDLPALDTLTGLATRLPTRPEEVPPIVAAARATGAGLRILDPSERREADAAGVSFPGTHEDLRDPALAGWRFGTDWVAQQGPWASTFRVVRFEGPPVRAWLVPLTGGRSGTILGTWSGDPFEVIKALRQARPVAVRRVSPERRGLAFKADGPGWLVVSELADPEWRGTWLASPERSAEIHRAFGRANQGAWMAVRVPGEGAWTLRLEYRGHDVGQGMIVSAFGFAVLGALLWRAGRRPAKGEGGGA